MVWQKRTLHDIAEDSFQPDPELSFILFPQQPPSTADNGQHDLKEPHQTEEPLSSPPLDDALSNTDIISDDPDVLNANEIVCRQ